MAKIIVVTAVLALALGIMIGVNARSGTPPSAAQILSNATPASADVPQLDSGPTRMTNVERIDAEIVVLNMLAAGISELNEEYEGLISEVTGLKAIRDTLKGEIRGGDLVSVPVPAD